MDFSIPQLGNTRFMYILPFAPDEALVEYTLFSESLLPEAVYEKAIADYITVGLGCDSFEVLEREKGSIPMTCNNLAAADSPHITHIGIAGGWAKPSTGYTFRNSVKNTDRLLQAIKAGGKLRMWRKDRFWYYDLVMLEVLARENARGSLIFSGMFRKLPAPLILRFLDGQTCLWEDLRVIAACPMGMFLRAAWRTGLKSLS
jgi:lycopene beta-cyclase